MHPPTQLPRSTARARAERYRPLAPSGTALRLRPSAAMAAAAARCRASRSAGPSGQVLRPGRCRPRPRRGAPVCMGKKKRGGGADPWAEWDAIEAEAVAQEHEAGQQGAAAGADGGAGASERARARLRARQERPTPPTPAEMQPCRAWLDQNRRTLPHLCRTGAHAPHPHAPTEAAVPRPLLPPQAPPCSARRVARCSLTRGRPNLPLCDARASVTGAEGQSGGKKKKKKGKRAGTIQNAEEGLPAGVAAAAEAQQEQEQQQQGGQQQEQQQEGEQQQVEQQASQLLMPPGTFDNSGGATARPSSGVRLSGVRKTFKKDDVLVDVSWDVKEGERVGLVGENGAGKTTQLRCITGEVEIDAGEVVPAKPDLRISYLTQEFEVDESRTVRDEFLSAFGESMDALRRVGELEKELEAATEDMDLMAKLLDELADAQRKSEMAAFSTMEEMEAKVQRMMPELGFKPEDADRLVREFSGGWQMRMSLGKILLQDPDLLLLDEPTNHLDLDALEWLEGYLKEQKMAMVIVSHDREFLDQLCTKVVETERGVARTYAGNYTRYVEQKAQQVGEQRLAWERQQKQINEKRSLIQRLQGGAQSGRATQAQKELDRLLGEDKIEKPFEQRRIPFYFPDKDYRGTELRSGVEVVTVEGMGHGYGTRALFNETDLRIERGDRVALVGPNGAGKSTLLKMMTGELRPDEGDVRMGEHGIVLNYFQQNQAEALDGDKTALQTIEEVTMDWKTSDIKGLLGRFRFKGEGDVSKKVRWLSGGEKARLSMAKFMVTPATLIVLDEPTNHLDIATKELMEEALRAFPFTVVMASHDRYFLKRVASRIVEVSDRQLVDYEGGYAEFVGKNESRAAKEAARDILVKEQGSKVKAKSKMTKAEKAAIKKEKAKNFAGGKAKGKASKNANRWN